MNCFAILYWDILKHLTITEVFPFTNKSGKRVLDNIFHKITSVALLPYQISITSVERFM
jgi:hypothetical protein